MNERQFKDVMDTALAKSGNDLEDYLSQFEDQPIVVSLLSGKEFDDIGVGRVTARKAFEQLYPTFEDDEGTLTESIEEHLINCHKDGYDIEELYMDLTMLDDKSGQDQIDFLADMFNEYAFPEIVSFAVLHDKKLGFGESTLAKAFGVKDCLPFYDTVVDILRDDNPTAEPTVGDFFEPMLAVPESRGQPDNPISQRKVDGIRVQLHIEHSPDGPTATVYTRRGNDVTPSLPEVEEIPWPNGNYILDAEVIGVDGSYSTTTSRVGRKRENVERDVEMHFALFDLVLHPDTDPDDPYVQRYTQLLNLEARIEDARTGVLSVTDDIEQAKDEAVENDEEGIIVKDLNGPYEFGKRSAYWQKIKMDSETVDLVITGFYEGEGRAAGTLGKIELVTSDGVHVGNSGSGFSDAVRDEIWQNQVEWLGRVVEIEARGLGTHDKLRMPIFKRDRSNDGEPDSFERVKELMKDI